MCLVLLVLILGSNAWSENTTSLLTQLRQEISFLQNVIGAIGNELNLIESGSKMHLKLKEEELKELRNSYNDRMNYLKAQLKLREEEKKELQKEYDQLKDSEGLPEILKSKHEEIVQEHQSITRTWRIVAITEAAIVVGVVVWLILK